MGETPKKKENHGKTIGKPVLDGIFHYPHAPWCWYIYLHNWVAVRANVGKYSSTMEHMGYKSSIVGYPHDYGSSQIPRLTPVTKWGMFMGWTDERRLYELHWLPICTDTYCTCLYIVHMCIYEIIWVTDKIIVILVLSCFALAFLRLHKIFITDRGRPCSDTPFVIPPGILKPSQPTGDDPNLGMALDLTHNFVRYSYIYIYILLSKEV